MTSTTGGSNFTACGKQTRGFAAGVARARRIGSAQRTLRAGLFALFVAASATLFVATPARAQVVTTTLSDANQSHGVAINPVTNKIYLADLGGTLTVIDGATNAVSSPSNTYGGVENWAVAVNPVTNMVYVVDRGASKIYAFNGATATSPATYSATISPGAGNLFAIAINPETNMIYVADDSHGYIVVINGSDNSFTTVSLGTTDSVVNLPVSLAVNPATNMIYVVENDSLTGCTSGCLPNQVAVINPGNNNAITNIAVGNSPVAVVVNPVKNLIYVANSGASSGPNPVTTVSVIDGSTNTVTANVTSPQMATPVGLAINTITNQVFVANSGSDYATVINGTTTPATDIQAANGTSGFVSIAVDTSTNQVYFASGSQGTIGIFNGSNLGAGSDIFSTQSDSNLEQVAVNPVTHKAYEVTNGSSESEISVIDGATYAVATPAYPQSQPWAVAVDPVTNKIFVADNASGTVSVIDGSTNVLDPDSPITVGTNPNALVVDPINNLVYVSNSGSSSVSVINGASLGSTPSTITLQNANNSNLPFTPNLLAFNPVLNQVYGASTAQGVGFSFAGGENSETISANTFFGGSTPIAIGTNPAQGYNYAVFSDDSSIQVSDVHGGTGFGVCSGPTAADVNTVTNTIYVACGGSSGTLDAIQGADSFTPGTSTQITLRNSSSSPTAVVVNPVTNTIYVTDVPTSGAAYLYVVSAANNNAVATINLGENNCYTPYSLAVNVASNKIYVLCGGDDNEPGPQVEVFDGATNTRIRILSVGGSVNSFPNEIAANPVTGNIYSLASQGGNPGAVSVYSENAIQSNSFTTTIAPLTPNNTTNVISPSFSFSTPGPATGVYFQVDSQQGAWTAATVLQDDNSAYFTGTASNLTPGFHILYAYATAGQESAEDSGPMTDGNSPIVGAIASYGFLVAPPIATANALPIDFGTVPVGGVSTNPNPILINNGNGGAASMLTYSYTISGPNMSEFVVNDSLSSCSSSGGTIASNTYCGIYVTFQPTTSGPASATLTWTDNSLGVEGTQQTVAFTAIGGVLSPTIGEEPGNPSYITTAPFAWSDSDANVVSYLCSFTSGMTVSSNYSACTNPASEPGLLENTYYTFAVEAVDNLGNTSPPTVVTWEVIPSSITLTVAGTGSGTVTSNPTGLSCSSSCSVQFDGVPVSLTATPNANSVFTGWSNEYNIIGNTCTGTTNPCTLQTGYSPQVVTATFSASSYNLSVTPSGSGTGTVTDGNTLSCGWTGSSQTGMCSVNYNPGSMVTITAIPTAPSSFVIWGGACSSFGTGSSCTLTMNSAQAVTAQFAAGPQVPTAYVGLGSEAFGTVGLTNGAYTQSGSTGILLSGLGVAANGNLYGGAFQGTQLYQVNPANGALTAVGSGNTTEYWDTGSTTTGVYALDPSLNLYSVDVTTGALTLIGSTGLTLPENSFSGASSGGSTLYFTMGTSDTPATLYSINTATGAATPIGSTGIVELGAMVYENGTLYAGSGTGPTYYIYSLNTSSGAATQITSTASGAFWGLAPMGLSVQTLGTGGGTVTDNQSFIDCTQAAGGAETGTCFSNASSGSMITLTAKPATTTPATTFGGWGGACASFGTSLTCNVTAGSTQVTADFVPPPTTITVTFPVSSTPVTETATYNCPLNSNPISVESLHAHAGAGRERRATDRSGSHHSVQLEHHRDRNSAVAVRRNLRIEHR